MIQSHIRGHKIVFNDGWIYADNSTPIKKEKRPCVKCGHYPTKDGHDHCIKNMNKVSHACCGHGVNDNKYYVKGVDNENLLS